jgi:excisionase family DNA binding protein
MAKPRRQRVPAQALTLLTPAEAGERLGASEMHVYRAIAAGELRAVDIAQTGAKRSKTRVRSDDLEAYIESRTREAGGPNQPAA